MRLNPINEILYRINLAKKYLEEAEKAYSRSDWRTTVSSSQLSAENSGKAVIAFYKIPSWSRDPFTRTIRNNFHDTSRNN